MLGEMQRADGMIAETFKRAGASDKYRAVYFEGGHKFDKAMQGEAWAWMDRFLKTGGK
jgi:hypothetical protein